MTLAAPMLPRWWVVPGEIEEEVAATSLFMTAEPLAVRISGSASLGPRRVSLRVRRSVRDRACRTRRGVGWLGGGVGERGGGQAGRRDRVHAMRRVLAELVGDMVFGCGDKDSDDPRFTGRQLEVALPGRNQPEARQLPVACPTGNLGTGHAGWLIGTSQGARYAAEECRY